MKVLAPFDPTSHTTRIYEVHTPSGYSGDAIAAVSESLARAGLRRNAFVLGLMRMIGNAAGDQYTVVQVRTSPMGHLKLFVHEDCIDRGECDIQTYLALQGT